MTTTKGKRLFIQSLSSAGVRQCFGNPGTTEMPLLDSLTDFPEITYHMALHEGVATGMADAYALASGKLGVVNLHVAPGLGNALGMIYNAWEGHSPVLVTAGQQDTRMLLREPLLSHNLVAMAAPVTKWSAQAERAADLPLLVHRAVKTAFDEPRGPVFLSLPVNVMEEDSDAEPLTALALPPLPKPDEKLIEGAAELLAEAKNPVIVAGEGVARAGVQAGLVALAEVIGAPVWNTLQPSGLNFPFTHDQYRGDLPSDQGRIRQTLGAADVLLLVCGDFFKEVFYSAQPPLPDGAAVIQIDPSALNLARNFPVQCGIAGDPSVTLHALRDAVLSAGAKGFRAAVEKRRGELAALKQADRQKAEERLKKTWSRRPISPARVMHELKLALPEGTCVVSEAITAAADMLRTLPLERPGQYYAARGGGIGQGLPSALGIQVAFPGRRVVCLSGDGSAMYSIQALWTAAHHRLPVVFIILSNRVYRILKINLDRYRSDFGWAGERPYPHMDLTHPDLGFVMMAEGMGVPGVRVEDPEQIGVALNAAFAAGTPYLVEIVTEGSWPVRGRD